MTPTHRRTVALLAGLLFGTPLAFAAPSPEERNLTELRLTVVNLLQGLVERGVLSREQAEGMVRDAQERASADATAAATLAEAEKDAVRVPYVPEIVRDEIRKQVVADLTGEVKREVVEQAQSDGWGVPGALPEWVRRMRWYGDLRVRSETDMYAEDNVRNAYLNFLAVNDLGGIGRAGLDALSNTTEDRQRLRARLRFGFETELGYGWTMGARLVTGDPRDPTSVTQNLGQYGGRYQVGLDQAWMRWAGASDNLRHSVSVTGGRVPSPWSTATEMVWDNDVTFDGIASQYRLAMSRAEPYTRFAYLTLAGFQIQEFELSKRDKWLVGAQTGVDWKFDGGHRLRFAASYYDYENVVGKRNELDSNLLDFTAPRFLTRGNTLFDIRNDVDTTTNLFALASDYSLVDVMSSLEWNLGGTHRATLTAEYVRNLGYDEEAVAARIGAPLEARVEGYQGEIAFGTSSLARRGGWRAALGYRYIERDAVLDAFSDSNLRQGGTDSQGFYFVGDYGLTERVSARLRYLSGNEIDGPPLGIDVLQIDLNTRF
jgi:hypothetical protein